MMEAAQPVQHNHRLCSQVAIGSDAIRGRWQAEVAAPAASAPPKRRSMNAFDLRSCLYSTSSVFLRCRVVSVQRDQGGRVAAGSGERRAAAAAAAAAADTIITSMQQASPARWPRCVACPAAGSLP